MIASLRRTVQVAQAEVRLSLRNRRAMVMTLLFVAVAALVMYGTISAFAAMERELLAALKLPAADGVCSVTTALWKSKSFENIIGHLVGGGLVFADIRGRHPLLLAYAMFIFQIAPLLTLIVSSPRIAADLRSGAARYWLARVTRNEWSLGKFFGEAVMLAVAMFVGGLAAWGVAVYRLPGMDGVRLLPGVLDWTARAWMHAFAWLGMFCGVSHLARSGGKATALSILAMMGAAAWPTMLSNLVPETGFWTWLSHLDALVPSGAAALMWRRSPSALVWGVAHLAALSFLFLSFGCWAFGRRDV